MKVFNSQICTSREQSERLLALGLKKETADCGIYYSELAGCDRMFAKIETEFDADEIPAWSLGRLLEMLPSPIKLKDDLPTFHPYAFLGLSQVSVNYHWRDYDEEERNLVGFYGNGFFAAVVDAIEWLIKEGYFNKEYVVYAHINQVLGEQNEVKR